MPTSPVVATLVLELDVTHSLRPTECERKHHYLFDLTCRCATCRLVPTRCPVLFLTRGAAVPGGLALRADFEILQYTDNLAPVVAAIIAPFQRCLAAPVDKAKPICQNFLEAISGNSIHPDYSGNVGQFLGEFGYDRALVLFGILASLFKRSRRLYRGVFRHVFGHL